MNFLKATIAGGLLFLLPVVLVLIVLGHAMRLAGKVAQPISKLLPDAVVGVGVVTVLAALLLVFISFLAGLAARTHAGKRIMRRFENSYQSTEFMTLWPSRGPLSMRAERGLR